MSLKELKRQEEARRARERQARAEQLKREAEERARARQREIQAKERARQAEIQRQREAKLRRETARLGAEIRSEITRQIRYKSMGLHTFNLTLGYIGDGSSSRYNSDIDYYLDISPKRSGVHYTLNFDMKRYLNLWDNDIKADSNNLLHLFHLKIKMQGGDFEPESSVRDGANAGRNQLANVPVSATSQSISYWDWDLFGQRKFESLASVDLLYSLKLFNPKSLSEHVALGLIGGPYIDSHPFYGFSYGLDSLVFTTINTDNSSNTWLYLYSEIRIMRHTGFFLGDLHPVGGAPILRTSAIDQLVETDSYTSTHLELEVGMSSFNVDEILADKKSNSAFGLTFSVNLEPNDWAFAGPRFTQRFSFGVTYRPGIELPTKTIIENATKRAMKRAKAP